MDMDALSAAVVKAQLPPSATAAVQAWLAEQLTAHEYAKLGQGGHTQNQVPLRQVFVDLPVADTLSDLTVHAQRTFFLDGLLSCPPANLAQACKPRSAPTVVAADLASDESKEEDSEDEDDDESDFSATLLIGGAGSRKVDVGATSIATPSRRIAKAFHVAVDTLATRFGSVISGVAKTAAKRPFVFWSS